MADKNLEPRSGGVRIKSGVLPGVREIRRPDFSKKAADIEKAEAERALNRGEDTDAADEAAVRASLEAQESGTEEEQLDESAITDEALWYVAHTYSGYENKVKTTISWQRWSRTAFARMYPRNCSPAMCLSIWS